MEKAHRWSIPTTTDWARKNQEIARLREELSRAAVRESELRQVLAGVKECSDDCFEDRGYAPGSHYTVSVCLFCGSDVEHDEGCVYPDLAAILNTPSPLADAAWEVLEAALERRAAQEAYSRSQVGLVSRGREEERTAFDRFMSSWRSYEDAVSSYRALLEGREEKTL